MFVFKKKIANLMDDEHASLPLAPMADVFIVVLIFLLKCFSYDITSVAANTDIVLPGAKAQGTVETTLRIDLSENELRFNDNLVLTLKNYQIEENDLDAGGAIVPLQNVLRTISSSPDEMKSTKVMLYADQNAPYTVVRSVLKTAVGLGLSKLQIAVAQE